MAAAAAREYLATPKRVRHGTFFFVNQEAGMEAPRTGPQQCLAQLLDETDGLHALQRSRYWRWQGYLEQVYAQASIDEPGVPCAGRQPPWGLSERCGVGETTYLSGEFSLACARWRGRV
jgi:hypothetical protein